MNIRPILFALLWVAAGLALGIAVQYYRAPGATVPAAAKAERNILYWVAPMDPSYRRDKPGKSPMGMDLVPVYADGGGADPADDDVRIDPAVVENLGVRTAPVAVSPLTRTIDTVGYVDYDEDLIGHVHLRTSGWIERLAAKAVGTPVHRGDVLFELYSPELVNAQEEYLQALQAGSRHLLEASRDRLLALGVDPAQIRTLAQDRKVLQRVPIHAAQDGIVARLNVREGMYVQPATEVMTLADLSSVWLQLDVFERQAAWVKVGETAHVELPYLPGRQWDGRVEFIYPSLDARTRTLQARLRFANPGDVMKPGMYARVRIDVAPTAPVLNIPLEALIRTGDANRVIVAEGDGHFHAAAVVPGIEAGDRVEIRDGLAAGERVVVSGQFLLDSEASLKASFQRMTAGRAAPAPAAASAPAEPSVASTADGAPVQATGVVDGVMPEHGMVKLHHDPIPALGWPAMTMDFTAAAGVDLHGLKPGARVRFSLARGADGSYRITAIAPAGEAGR